MRLAEVPRDRPVFTICAAGMRSLRVAQFLKQVGFNDVVSVSGGTDAWQATGKPIVTEDTTLARLQIVETEWTHAGALSYSI
jgi:rhodanese-related sulfurtransferase